MPARGSRSSTQTLCPRRATANAAASPTTPAPTTAVSIRSIIHCASSFARAADFDRVAAVIPSRVLITGASGQLATHIARTFVDRNVIAHTRATLDIADGPAVRRAVADAAPELIVNCAAFNDVDGAEARPLDALAVNAFGVRALARAAEDAGAVLVHYSSDFVFDGAATAPYEEEDAPSPRSTYAASKLLGEWFALESPGAFVLRVESLFGSPP